MQQDDLDKKATSVFAGKVVRKDLLHQIKGGENVPSYVLEYLLGKYCASDNDEEIRIGVDAVKETLTTNYFRHDEANKAQSMVEQKGRHRFIDRIEVRFLASENKYWASMDHFGYTKIHIPVFSFSRTVFRSTSGRPAAASALISATISAPRVSTWPLVEFDDCERSS